MKKLLLTIFCFIVFCPFAFSQMDMSKVIEWNNPSGKVTRVEVGYGEKDWPTNSIPYVTNGLIAYWDAIWNTGLGVHDSEATVWKDLVGTRDFTLVGNQYWSSNSWIVNAYTAWTNNPTYAAYYSDESLPENQTMEVVVYPKITGSSAARITSEIETGGQDSKNVPNFMVHYRDTNELVVYRYSSSIWYQPIENYNSFLPHVHVMTHEAGSTNVNYYIDGKLVYTFTNATGNCTGKTMSLANYIGSGSSQYKRAIDGEYYAIRIYNRILTDEEIKYNSAIDALRFDNRDLCSDDTTYESVSNTYKKVHKYKKQIWPNTIPYSTDGLVAMWDGEWNAGIGVHDPNTETWKDLIGDRDATLTSAGGWTNNALICGLDNTNAAFYTDKSFNLATGTLEVVSKKYNNDESTEIALGIKSSSQTGSNSIHSLFYYVVISNTPSFVFTGFSSNAVGNGPLPSYVCFENKDSVKKKHTFSSTFIGTATTDTVITAYMDGIESTNKWVSTSGWSGGTFNKYMQIGGRSSSSPRPLHGEIYCIRWYNRILTDEEIKNNAKIDSIRFGTEYPYAKDAFSWIDLTDTSTLFTDTTMTNHPNVGDIVLRVQDKADPSSVWICDMTKTNNGLAPSVITDSGVANVVLYAQSDEKSAIYKTTDDFSNAEYATVLVFNNYRGYGTASQRIITTRSSGRFFSAFMTASRLYGFNFSRQDESQINWIAKQATIQELQSIMQSGPCIMTFIGSVKDGTTRNMKIKLNGKVIVDYTDTITEPFDPAYNPHVSICNTTSWAQMPADYLENIWWKTIPDNLDEIENTLMEKYNIQKLE